MFVAASECLWMWAVAIWRLLGNQCSYAWVLYLYLSVYPANTFEGYHTKWVTSAWCPKSGRGCVLRLVYSRYDQNDLVFKLNLTMKSVILSHQNVSLNITPLFCCTILCNFELEMYHSCNWTCHSFYEWNTFCCNTAVPRNSIFLTLVAKFICLRLAALYSQIAHQHADRLLLKMTTGSFCVRKHLHLVPDW